MMVVPAVAISTVLGALNGYVLTKWRFRGDNMRLRPDAVRLLHPVPDRADPDGAHPRHARPRRHRSPGLVLVHVVYGLGFTTLFFRNYYEAFPTELVRAAQIDGAGFFQIFRRILLPIVGADHRRLRHLAVHQHLERLPVRRLVLAASTRMPMTVALNNLVNSSTGVKEYNVHFAGAIIAALPTLVVYIVAGRYFVRGLMAGAVKG